MAGTRWPATTPRSATGSRPHAPTGALARRRRQPHPAAGDDRCAARCAWTSSSTCARRSHPRRCCRSTWRRSQHARRPRLEARPGRAHRGAGEGRLPDHRGSMTEGHPCFVANNGRLGFGVDEYHAYAPETGAPGPAGVARRPPGPVGVLVRSDGLAYDAFVRGRDGRRDTAPRSPRRSRDLGLDLADYRLLPVHPWQWEHRIAVTFAGDLARRHLVYLGESDDDVPAAAVDPDVLQHPHPERHYVKTALSVLNMGFVRGLSAEYMEARRRSTTGWRGRRRATRSCSVPGFQRAARAGRGRLPLAAVRGGPPRRGRRTARCWPRCGGRAPRCADGERLATMASLLHVDRDGDVGRGRVGGGVRVGRRGLARAYLSGRVPHAAVALLLRLRAGVHAARGERDPRAARRRAGGG